MTHFTTVTRRTFGTMIGATAVAVPGLVSAAVRQPRDETILELNSVPLAWPQYRKIDTFAVAPQVGDRVTLVREAHHGFEDEAVGVYTAAFRRLGYIPRKHNAAMSWALDRGVPQEARISQIATPEVRGKQVRGWGAFHIDVKIRAPML